MTNDRRDYDRVELVWPGKRTEVERVRLPFQVIERVNDVRRSRDAQASMLTGAADLPDWWPEGWRNKLIWGDNKYVLASLLDEFAGKVDLIYIDPPFATGADFSFEVNVGEESVTKEPSAIEEVAYRDTWGRGLESYLQWIFEAATLLWEALSPKGSIYVHIGPDVSNYVRCVLDEAFGSEHFRNEIVWKRSHAHSDTRQGARHFGRVTDSIFFYAKSTNALWNQQHMPYDAAYIERDYRRVDSDGRRYRIDNLQGPGGGAAGNPYYEVMGVSRYWRFSKERMNELIAQGRVIQTRPGAVPQYKRYLDEMPGLPVQNLWSDLPIINNRSVEALGYPTQKPEALVDRLISTSSEAGALVLDCFVGSGTTAAAAEKLGRRWIAADIGRFAVQTTRKRLLDITDCRPFEVLNLGRYERRYWQGVHAGEAIWEYYQFILGLYGAQSISGFAHLHGEQAGRMVHVGATDAPVTVDELERTLEECAANGLKSVDVLGWEWEMGLNPAGKDDLARKYSVDARLFNIPREVMDKRAVDAGDVHFFELSVADVRPHLDGGAVELELAGFLPAVDEYMRQKVGDKVTKWSDWIDYWSVDFEFDGETFVNRWQAYRTRKDPKLALRSDPHEYAQPGTYDVVVKVIDIFGNDTTHELAVSVS